MDRRCDAMGLLSLQSRRRIGEDIDHGVAAVEDDGGAPRG